ncbi:aminotransferase class IV [Lutibacter sp.]
MINFNGTLLQKTANTFNFENRAFKYGDALFETLKVTHGKIAFLEDHYFRLMASMRMLRMDIPMDFTMEYLEKEILKTVEGNAFTDAAVRFTVFREAGGLYTPKTNKISYLVEVRALSNAKLNYTIDLFKDYYIYSGLLSTVKTTNKITNVLAGIYASENEFDNCILLNERKQVAEVINGNVFVVSGNTVKTPPISDGCVKGIIRKKIIEIVSKHPDLSIEEVSISPFELPKADEIFITNAIVGIQSVTNYRKKTFTSVLTAKIKEELVKLV